MASSNFAVVGSLLFGILTKKECVFMYRIKEFEAWLKEREKSENTTQKYIRDVRGFLSFVPSISKENVLEYKEHLKKNYRPKSVNSMLSSVNSFLEFIGRSECRVKLLKLQKNSFADAEKVLTKNDYERLVEAARRQGKERLYYLLQTICATGIRVSELKFITVEALRLGQCTVDLKGKVRPVFIPKKLSKALLKYCKDKKISSGSVFVTKNGKPLDRSNIWAEMKKLCKAAGVDECKVFPHNLRHLFARIFYAATKDIAKLSDILGHSSINTTRIYVMDSGEAHRREIEKLSLLLC